MIEIVRRTSETELTLRLRTGADPVSRIATGVRFLDHMLETLARYGGFELVIEATGDLKHHLIEDVAIALGQAVKQLATTPIARYGDRVVPMDDALVHVSLDVGGRPYYEGPLPSSYYEHWMQSFAMNAAATLHVRVLRGKDRHHVVEAAFKALGVALRDALAPASGVFSTKGAVRLEERASGAPTIGGAAPERRS